MCGKTTWKKVPTWGPTYPIPRYFWVDDFPFPKVGYVIVSWRVPIASFMFRTNLDISFPCPWKWAVSLWCLSKGAEQNKARIINVVSVLQRVLDDFRVIIIWSPCGSKSSKLNFGYMYFIGLVQRNNRSSSKVGHFGDVDCRKTSPKLNKLHVNVMPNHTAHSNHTLQVSGLCLSWSNDQLEYQSQQKHTANATLQQKPSLMECKMTRVIRFSFSGFPKPCWTPIPWTHTYTKAPKIHNPTHA